MVETTQKEFEALEKEARKLGKQTKRSCNVIHDALKTLAELGIPKFGGLADVEKSKKVYKATHECLVCGHSDTVTYNMDTYMEVSVCPKCSGAYVDLWKINKYKHLIRSSEDKMKDYKEKVDKAMREVAKEMDQWGENCVKYSREPLLTIELQDETSVPKVFYKGEEITAIVHVDFDWCTRSCEPLSGGMKLNIEHSDKKVKYPNVRQIAHKAGKFAFDNE